MTTKIKFYSIDTAKEVLSVLTTLGLSKHNAKLSCDSRKIQAGDVFAAMTVRGVDGRAFMAQALAQKARVILADAQGMTPWQTQLNWIADENDRLPVVILVPQLAMQLGEIGCLWYEVEKPLKIVGITGTNGKTTSCLWLSQSLTQLGQKVASIGTLGVGVGDVYTPTGYTTPDALLLQSIFADLAKISVDTVVMEVSSHALDQGRVNAVTFETAILTNFSQDHLDYHVDLDDYWRAKAKLFAWPHLKNAVLNRHETKSLQLLPLLPYACRLWTYGIEKTDSIGEVWRTVPNSLHVLACQISQQADGIAFELIVAGLHATPVRFPIQLPIIGLFNLENWLGVLACCLSMGYDIDTCLGVLQAITAVPGRMQQVNDPSQNHLPLVVVDFAHTPDAIHKVLSALRPQTERRGGQLWCVFGCGGNRDASKRPLMARAAATLADQLVITSDNPRYEDPLQIIEHVLGGLTAGTQHIVEPDRALAIDYAIAHANEKDVVVLAGKGHESTQEIAGEKTPFSDALIAKQCLNHRSNTKGESSV